MATASRTRRPVPRKIYALPLKLRFKWARETAGLSHDRLVEKLGRSNRGHLIKIEKGDHVPRQDLRDSIADATNVPRELFSDEDDEESDPMAAALMAVVRELVRKELQTSLSARVLEAREARKVTT